MGKSSPTKLQLKHVPDSVVLGTVFLIQSMPTVWITTSDDFEHMRKVSYRTKRMATLWEIQEALKPLPEKLVWAKLKKLEDQRKIESYGPAGIRFRVVE